MTLLQVPSSGPSLEWFSSLASASAFSFAFLVFLSSFFSVTAFSFYRGGGGTRQHVSGTGETAPRRDAGGSEATWRVILTASSPEMCGGAGGGEASATRGRILRAQTPVLTALHSPPSTPSPFSLSFNA
ncbi:hypothetical protein EYF80_050806 [Liparis tanakae]|uniref:Uncharacterized protein n=1 Tax=Liparis tanakae TaxID=230148 RepID=A0A4Z2FDH2_9TELE|nr:hypothetical protein EYF80_050806 [Liparis tanakae]